MSTLSIGNELKDSFAGTSKWVQYNLEWLHEVEGFYKQRSRLEKEYSEKLKALTGEYFTKKSAATVMLGVGEKPSVTPGSIEAASVVAWNEILSQTELVAKDHGQLAAEFEKNIAGQLNGLYTKLDITMTKINGYYSEMDSKKQTSYTDLEKAKKEYDEACSSMEMARNKYTKSSNDRNKKKVHEKEVDMNIAKNAYLIKINQANRIKDKYYFQDIPESLDLLQDLNEAKTLYLNDIWKQASAVEISFSERVAKRMKTANDVIVQNKPSLGTAMYIKHNIRNWKEPQDFQFKPSPVWHDDEKFIVPSETEVTDLRIKLAEAEKNYNRMQDLTQGELSKLSDCNKIKQNLKSNEDSIDTNKFYNNLKNYLSIISGFTHHETLKLIAEVTIESIQNNVPDEYDLSTDNIDLSKTRKKGGLFSKLKKNILLPDVGIANGGSNHSKSHKNSLFSGISSGNNNVHHENSNNNINDNDVSNANTNDDDESHSIFSGQTSNSITTAHTSTTNRTSNNNNASSNSGCKVLYAYGKQDDDEISISLGDRLELIAKDNGSGWTQVKNITQGGGIGLVPTSYVEITAAVSSGSRGPAPSVPPPRRNTVLMRTVTAQYAYDAQGDDEMSLSPGDVVKVIRGDDGSGWTYGELNGEKGLVPTSYCK